MKLIIEDEEGRNTTMPLAEGVELTIGRQEDNAIRLAERNVSRKHARLIRKNGQVLLEDLGSYCGVLVNKQRIKSMVRVSMDDVIQIGDYDLTLEREPGDDDQGTTPVPPVPSGSGESGAEAQATHDVGFARVPSQRLSTAIISLDDPDAYKDVPAVDIPIEQAPRLVVESGDRKGTEYALIRTVLTLGRDYDNDIPIDHRSLSRHHCRFVRIPNGEWKIVDTDSANGVAVNGEKYGVSSLASGDSILVGKVLMTFYLPGARRTVAASAKSIPPLAYVGMGAVVVLLLGIIAMLLLRPSAQPAAVDASPAVPAAPTVQVAEQPAPVASAKASAAEAQPVAEASAATAEAADSAQVADEADDAAKPSSEQDASDAKAAMDIGKSLMERGKYGEAMKSFSKAVELKAEGARELFEKASAEADAKDAIEAASELMAAGNFDDALSRLDQIAADSSFAAKARELKARISDARPNAEGNAAAPVAEKEEAKPGPAPAPAAPVAKKPAKRAGTTYNYGSAYMAIPADKMRELDGYLGDMCDRPGKAMALLKRLIKENPDYGDAYMFLGTCYAEQDQPEQAEKYYRTFLKRWPKHPDAPVVRSNMGR